jgi:hypothetical protein
VLPRGREGGRGREREGARYLELFDVLIAASALEY